MRRLLVTTASVVALGLGGIGLANATGNTAGKSDLSGSVAPPAASTTTQSQNTTAMTTQRATRTTSHQATATRMSRSEVIQAQRKLRADGLYRGRIDGRFGAETRTALRHFQQQNHLPLTARLDNRTMSNLMGGAMGQGSSRPPKSTHAKTMGKGQLQQNVNQPGKQPENTMGQGSSGGEAKPTQMTPPTQPQTPSSSSGATNQNSNTGTQTNQK